MGLGASPYVRSVLLSERKRAGRAFMKLVGARQGEGVPISRFASKPACSVAPTLGHALHRPHSTHVRNSSWVLALITRRQRHGTRTGHGHFVRVLLFPSRRGNRAHAWLCPDTRIRVSNFNSRFSLRFLPKSQETAGCRSCRVCAPGLPTAAASASPNAASPVPSRDGSGQKPGHGSINLSPALLPAIFQAEIRCCHPLKMTARTADRSLPVVDSWIGGGGADPVNRLRWSKRRPCWPRRRNTASRWTPTADRFSELPQSMGPFGLTMERALCETDWIRMRGILRTVITTTMPPMPNRKPSWIWLGLTSTCRAYHHGRLDRGLTLCGSASYSAG